MFTDKCKFLKNSTKIAYLIGDSVKRNILYVIGSDVYLILVKYLLYLFSIFMYECLILLLEMEVLNK